MMPHPTTKKQRLDHAVVAVGDDFLASFDDLSVDLHANILAFLPLQDITHSRRINKKSREAVKMTIVPLTDFRVDNAEKYNTLNVMTRALPNLQQITIGNFGWPHGEGHKWSDGEDSVRWARDAKTADWTTHDIEIISNFSKLRILGIDSYAPLNGRYPFLFNSFPLLQKLSIRDCPRLKLDLEMLAGFPILKELDLHSIYYLTGNISSLRVLKDTLEKVEIVVTGVEGNFMDLADFPHLKELDLGHSDVTGDIRNIGESDFSSLERLCLPKTVYGGNGFTLQSISDGPDIVRAVYLLKKKIPALDIKYWHGELSRESPDWYEPVNSYFTPVPPFNIWFFEAGPRIGYRWTTISYSRSTLCEVNWLDPEPERESSDYEKYTEELQKTNRQVGFYKGFHQPPTEEEYNRLHEVLQEEGEWW